MAIQVKLLVIISFLFFFTLSFCEAKKATVKVVGILHSKDSIKNQPSNIDSSLGTDVFILCNNAKTQGNGGIDMHGKFNVTLSADVGEDGGGEIDGCYARLQGNSGAPCHIQEPQSASVKVLTNGESENGAVTLIEFSPLDCQSAFFWPFPNLTFLGSPPSPPEYTSPPSPEDLPLTPSPSQQPIPPPPQPSYDPTAPALPPSEIEAPSPAPPPMYQEPIRSSSPPPVVVTSPPQAPPPTYQDPIRSSSPPPAVVTPPPQAPPPQPIYEDPLPSPQPSPELTSPPLPTPPSATIPGRRRPSPIPKAPPIPRLPLTPSVPRKYFNPPNSSKSKPPRLV